mmetsp:Transcript_1520/g.3966  ORF Transcript_1520/g.3966 Transcript_1520/m.3966 type:complete len:89 (-) Transcript_1520:2431-2697(-)
MIAQSKTQVYGTGESTVVKCRYLNDNHNCIPYFFPAYDNLTYPSTHDTATCNRHPILTGQSRFELFCGSSTQIPNLVAAFQSKKMLCH